MLDISPDACSESRQGGDGGGALLCVRDYTGVGRLGTGRATGGPHHRISHGGPHHDIVSPSTRAGGP